MPFNAHRYLSPSIQETLASRMVFLSGPRQVGKTSLAVSLLKNKEQDDHYFNYDHDADRKNLLEGRWPEGGLIVLDEIHKYRRWRNWLKGIYDRGKSQHRYLVTGSARLDVYSRGGDSLLGRYRHYRLHPFSVAELSTKGENEKNILERLFLVGGFPEPYTKNSLKEKKLWHKERRQLLFREDIRDLERIIDIHRMEMLTERLPLLVGSPLSIHALAQDLEIAHKTAAHWITILERLYYCYRIYPFGASKIRAVKKESKLYLWDWSEIEDEGIRFENLVAGHLLKYCHFIEDTEGNEMDLRYLRDTDKREVDFVVLKNKKPLFAVECKLKDPSITKHMHYFKERTNIPHFYLVHNSTEKTHTDTKPGLTSTPAEKFLKNLRV